MIQFVTLLAKPLLGKFKAPEGAEKKIAVVNTFLAGGTGNAWIPLGRLQETIPAKLKLRSTSNVTSEGIANSGDTSVRWRQFDWPVDQTAGDCTFNCVRWRFYQNGLICLELVGSKDKTGIDTRDLLGHCVELRDNSGFLIGVWTAAFLINKDSDQIAFAASNREEFLPLMLHFDEIAQTQTGFCFTI